MDDMIMFECYQPYEGYSVFLAPRVSEVRAGVPLTVV